MNYNSVAEILDSIDATRERLVRRLDGLSDERQRFRPAPEAWSISEIVEHLSIIEAQMVQLVGVMLKKTEASGMMRPGGDGSDGGEAVSFAPVNINDFIEQSKTQKFNAPETVRPSGQLSLADSLARLRDSRSTLRSFQPRIERIDGAAAQYPHPFMGMFNLYQWLLFIGAHEERHLAQIETRMEAKQ